MRKENDEPVFSTQEQAVVYLFSRYWEKVAEFKSKKIIRIHTHFPDFTILSTKNSRNESEEGIEFEYSLSNFRSHIDNGQLKKLRQRSDIKVLYIIYWEDNDDHDGLKKHFSKAGITPKFVCLKDWFRARVKKTSEKGPLRAFWEFSRKQGKAAYTKKEIQTALEDLLDKGVVKEFPLDKHQPMYRAMGWDKAGSDFIECDHWERIHFFTTTAPMGESQVPSKLFVKPNGYKHFIGYFDMETAFVIKKGGESVKEFIRNHYFYEYDADHYEHVAELSSRRKCFVCTFNPLRIEQGRQLFQFLNEKYELGVRGAIILDQRHHKEIHRIIR